MWTDEKRAQVIEDYSNIMKNDYTTDDERANASIEVVKELAETYDETTNGVRMILSKAKVYIKKAPTAKAAAKEGGTKRVNKAEAIADLTKLIEASGATADEEILSKLTGKAAVYFSGVLQQLS